MVEGVESKIESKKETNKAWKIISDILFIIFMIIISFFIFITAQSKITGQEPSILGHRLYIVESGSMLPALKINSMIVVKEMLPQNINNGDIVSFYGKNADVRITHRVVDIQDNGDVFITRGDANNTNDPNPVTKDKIIGKVLFSVPLLGALLNILSTPMAIVIIIIFGAGWMILPKVLKKRE